MRDMQIYTNEEYLNKQKEYVLKNAFNASYLTGKFSKKSVVKNYIYYDVPIKIV